MQIVLASSSILLYNKDEQNASKLKEIFSEIILLMFRKARMKGALLLYSRTMYRDIAGGNPVGARLFQDLNEHWVEWLRIVSESLWIRNWSRSKLFLEPDSSNIDWRATPNGVMLKDLRLGLLCGNTPGVAAVAHTILLEATWNVGFLGLEQSDSENFTRLVWLRGTKLDRNNRATGTQISRMRDLQAPICIPAEYGSLDRWLYPMWLHAHR